jgi:hypothetical protein
MSWSDYVNCYLVNLTDNDKEHKNVCEHGLIVGMDGTVWASTAGFKFGTETVKVEKEDGSGTVDVQLNEFVNLKDALDNNGVCSKAGGLRLNGKKFFMVNFDKDKNVMYLKTSGGGAAVAKSNLGIVIGLWSGDKKMGDGTPQNAGIANLAVEKLQEFLVTNNL